MGQPSIQCRGPAVVFVLLAILASPVVRPAQSDQPAEAAEAAANFIKTLASGDLADLPESITDPFTFEGRVIKGQDKIAKFIEEHLAKTRAELKNLPNPRIDVYSYKAAVAKFGKPPRKFSHIKLKNCLVVTASYVKRRGFLMILKKHKQEGWRVTAVTD